MNIEGETGATSPFSLTKSCTGPLAPTSSCVATVSFAPTDTMTHTATLMVMNNGMGAPQKVAMSGTGKAPKK